MSILSDAFPEDSDEELREPGVEPEHDEDMEARLTNIRGKLRASLPEGSYPDGDGDGTD